MMITFCHCSWQSKDVHYGFKEKTDFSTISNMNVNDALWSIAGFPFGSYHLPRRSYHTDGFTNRVLFIIYIIIIIIYIITFSIYLDLTLELKVTFPTPLIRDKTKSTVGLHTITGRQPAYAANKTKTLKKNTFSKKH